LPVFQLPGTPKHSTGLSSEPDRDAPRITLVIWECQRCRFVQHFQAPDEEYYDCYAMACASSAYERYAAEHLHNFLTRYDLVGARVLDLGCGNGKLLDQLAAEGCRVVGMEVSEPTRELSRARGHHVLAAADDLAEIEPFDGLVCRQVLEHVTDVAGLIATAFRSMRPGGVALFDVPSLEKALTDRRFVDFFSDHVNYFSLDTLRCALELGGFTIAELGPVFKDEWNQAIARRPAAHDWQSLATARVAVKGALEQLVGETTASGGKVALWGAGGKGVSLVGTEGLNGIAYAIDSDQGKQGRYLPSTSIEVTNPERLLTEPVDVIVVTAIPYFSEIHAQIRNLVGDSVQISLLDEGQITAVP
jgi:SAM-dependent methyltransferase